MKKLQTTLFIILSLSFSTQLIRHIHLYFYGDEASILEPHLQFPEHKRDVQENASLEELLSQHKALKEETFALEEGLGFQEIREFKTKNRELYSRIQFLEKEIKQREKRSRDIRNIIQFSLSGFLLIAAGTLLYHKGRIWTGTSLMIPGFAELVWWTKPDFFGGGAIQEYGTLLLLKIGITTLSLATLYLLHKQSKETVQ